MFVAHPDDELLFGGWDLDSNDRWKVVSITNGFPESHVPWKRGNRRWEEFRCAMNALPHVVEAELWDYQDHPFVKACRVDVDALKEQLRSALREKAWLDVVTHNADGEYGHWQHKFVHKVVNEVCVELGIQSRSFGRGRISAIGRKVLRCYSSEAATIQKHLDEADFNTLNRHGASSDWIMIEMDSWYSRAGSVGLIVES